MGRLLAIVVGALAACAPAAAQDAAALRGVALVIGNGDYQHLAKLPNPPNDADAIEALLSELGFDSVRRNGRDARDLRRDLERFAEDAEDADVAVLYYSGHGIEAGGENFLVPVDADLSSLSDASQQLVPLSALIARLRATVPITIVLLDACRDNPFPAGATVRLSPDASPAPIAVAGLAVADTRGAAPLPSLDASKNDRLGIVIGYAAAPGKPALDGPAGGNSPYAAALLRHFDAMAGEEFGTVMRMVTEEVYLDTEGRQHPWVNESLRRLLYLGGTPPEPDGDQAKILGERRQLLVRIADLPSVQRARAETLAKTGGLPMSIIFAMMRELDIDPTADPAIVESRLREEVAAFAAARKAREALSNPDPEVERLSKLADEAELEGALVAADGFREQAKARVIALRSTRQKQIAELKQRVGEDAAVYARSAETKKLMFRHAEAARDYGEAAGIVGELDLAQAARYRLAEIDAWLVDGDLQGTLPSLRQAELLAREMVATVGATASAQRAEAYHRLGLAILIRNRFQSDPALLREGADALDFAIADADALPATGRARILLDAGRGAGQIGYVTHDAAMLIRAGDRFRQAETLATESGDEAMAAEAIFRRMQANYIRWTMDPDPALISEIMVTLTAMMPLLGDDVDALSGRYVVSASSLALDAALRLNTQEALSLAAEINGTVVEMFDSARFPLVRAEADFVTARIGLEWAERFGDDSQLSAALSAQDAALDVTAQVGIPTDAALFQKALVLISMGARQNDIARLDEAGVLLAELAARPQIKSNPAQVQAVVYQTARADAAAGVLVSNIERLRNAVETLRSLREETPATADPLFATQLITELGKATAWLASMTDSIDDTRAAVVLLTDAIGRYDVGRASESNLVPFTQVFQAYSVAATDLALKVRTTDNTEQAIAVAKRLLGLYEQLDYTPGRTHAANALALLMAQALRLAPDPDRLTEAETFAAEAVAGAAEQPQFAAYFNNAACEVATERARQDQSLDKARAALADCRTAQDGLKAIGDEAAIAQSSGAVARARALVAELGG